MSSAFRCRQKPLEVSNLRELKIAMAIALLSLGCNRAESPAKTATDVASARQEARQNVNEAVEKAQEKVEKAQEKADEARADAVKSEYDILLARIDGEHKVRIEACEGLSGDQQKSCKERADAEYEEATANAKSAKSQM
jgi:hypothetical protein